MDDAIVQALRRVDEGLGGLAKRIEEINGRVVEIDRTLRELWGMQERMNGFEKKLDRLCEDNTDTHSEIFKRLKDLEDAVRIQGIEQEHVQWSWDSLKGAAWDVAKIVFGSIITLIVIYLAWKAGLNK